MTMLVVFLMIFVAVVIVRFFDNKSPELSKNIGGFLTSEINKKMLQRTSNNTLYNEQARYANFVQLMARMVQENSASFPVKIMVTNLPNWLPQAGLDGVNVCRLEYLRQNILELSVEEKSEAEEEALRYTQAAIGEHYKRNIATVHIAIWRVEIHSDCGYFDFVLLYSTSDLQKYKAELQRRKFLKLQAEQTSPPPRDEEF